MKKITLLTSILALTACGGGSGSGAGTNNITWSNDTIITQDMLNNNHDSRATELQKKLDTIRYVEDNLGSLLENKELTGIQRSATTDKMLSGLKLVDIEARYQQALSYFDILKKVLNITENSKETITAKEIKIAYSLSANVKYEDISSKNLPDNIVNAKDSDTILKDVVIEITLTIKIEYKDQLQEHVPEEIKEDIPALIPDDEKPEKPDDTDLLPEHTDAEQTPQQDESKYKDRVYRLSDDSDNLEMTFNMKDNLIEGINLVKNDMGNFAKFTKNGDVSSYTSEGYTYTVERTFNMYKTVLNNDPKSSPEALQALKDQLQRDIEHHNCYEDCIDATNNMIQDNSYKVTKQNNGEYLVEFPVTDTWREDFLDKGYADEHFMNSTKAQQVEYLLERHFITEEKAREILNDPNIPENTVIPDVCGESDCLPTLEAIAANKGQFVLTTFDMNLTDYNTIGLTYASFGRADMKINFEDGVSDEFSQIFYGGDKNKLINKEEIETDITFTGVALGEVQHVSFDEQGEEDKYETKTLQDNNAKLIVSKNSKDIKEELSASFANDGWYDVQVVRDNNSDNITFKDNSDGKLSDNWRFIGDKFNDDRVPNEVKPDSNTYKVDNFTTETEVDPVRGLSRNGSFETLYFGEQQPSETVGVVSYKEENGDPIHETGKIKFEIGFGMKKDN